MILFAIIYFSLAFLGIMNELKYDIQEANRLRWHKRRERLKTING